MRGPGTGTTFLIPLPLPPPAGTLNCAKNSPVAFNDIKHLARSMPADGLEAQDVVPPRCGCWVAHMAIFLGKAHTLARALSRCSACNHWRLRLATVMAGLWSSRSSLSDQQSRAELAAPPLLSFLQSGPNSLGIIWLSEVRVGGFSGWRRRWWPIRPP